MVMYTNFISRIDPGIYRKLSTIKFMISIPNILPKPTANAAAKFHRYVFNN